MLLLSSWGIFHHFTIPNNGTPLALLVYVRLQRVFFPRMRKPAPIQRNEPSAAAKQFAPILPTKPKEDFPHFSTHQSRYFSSNFAF